MSTHDRGRPTANRTASSVSFDGDLLNLVRFADIAREVEARRRRRLVDSLKRIATRLDAHDAPAAALARHFAGEVAA